jgi:hypothetical protein
MKNFDAKWQSLVAAARQVPAADEAAAPYGFATRVAARALAQERPGLLAVFGRFSIRALWVACVLTLASMAVNYLEAAWGDEDADQSEVDPVAETLTFSS